LAGLEQFGSANSDMIDINTPKGEGSRVYQYGTGDVALHKKQYEQKTYFRPIVLDSIVPSIRK
jgi:hypothetical protein